ncbi:MAG: Ribosomal L32p protein family [Pseudomonadota bacterium]|jgi:ribosomal protein L32
MAVPKRKTSKSKRDMRSAGKGLVKKNVMFREDGSAYVGHIKHGYNKRIRIKKEEISEEVQS